MTPTEIKLAALAKVLAAVQAYMPPDGLTKDQLIDAVIEAVDNPEFNRAMRAK